MDIETRVLFLATEFLEIEEKDWTILDGYDFGCGGGVVPKLVAVTLEGLVSLDEAEFLNVRRPGRGWRRETSTPERFPSPPFLVTEDASYAFIANGHVRIELSQERREDIAKRIAIHGEYQTPVSGNGWLGWLTISPDDHECQQGTLLAFSNSIQSLPKSPTEVLDVIDEPLGFLQLIES